MQRIIELALTIVILIGAVFLWRSTSTRSELTREHDRLANKVGRLQIKDPTKIHLLAINTDDPQHFAWRAYFPPNYHYAYSCSSGGGSGSNSSAWEGILRVRVREVNGKTLLSHALLNGSGLRSIGSEPLTKVLKEQPGMTPRLQAEQLGTKGLVMFDTSEVLTLVKLSLSDEALADAKQHLNEWELKQLTPHLERIRIGPPGFPERERDGK
ncbi:hypothetical protein [Anatilimnocola floriformis]|uniref:hypothetical protein n=1 Tax=Anatilimnocola floriformis TaxID=2948575 RepID=UPI0020C3A921|nr:hypothetical protein [Anatilimnocola floriformis]